MCPKNAGRVYAQFDAALAGAAAGPCSQPHGGLLAQHWRSPNGLA